MGKSSRDQLTNLDWLVDRRSKVQNLLLGIYKSLGKRGRKASMDVRYLLVGVGYSLWRAVFLADSARDWNTVSEHGAKFLLKLIQDNAIGYPQERDMRAWTVGYYLNGAFYRLSLAYDILGHRTSLQRKVKTFIKTQSAPGFRPELMKHWDTAHEAARELLGKIDV